MAFRPAQNLKVRTAIAGEHIGPDGVAVDHSCFVTFQILRASEVAAFFDGPPVPVRPEGMSDPDWAATNEASRRTRKTDTDFVRKVIVGWGADSGIEDDNGLPLPFSAEALDLLLDHPWFVSAAAAAYTSTAAGARRGN